MSTPAECWIQFDAQFNKAIHALDQKKALKYCEFAVIFVIFFITKCIEGSDAINLYPYISPYEQLQSYMIHEGRLNKLNTFILNL